MTLAQLEERVTALEQVKERLAALEQFVEQLQTQKVSPPKPEVEQDDFIPGKEYDFVVSVPPEESIIFQARIVSIEPGPPGLPLSEEEWASLGLEDEDE